MPEVYDRATRATELRLRDEILEKVRKGWEPAGPFELSQKPKGKRIRMHQKPHPHRWGIRITIVSRASIFLIYSGKKNAGAFRNTRNDHTGLNFALQISVGFYPSAISLGNTGVKRCVNRRFGLLVLKILFTQ